MTFAVFFFQIIFNTFFVIFYLNITVSSFSLLCEPQVEKVISCQEAHCFWVVILWGNSVPFCQESRFCSLPFSQSMRQMLLLFLLEAFQVFNYAVCEQDYKGSRCSFQPLAFVLLALHSDVLCFLKLLILRLKFQISGTRSQILIIYIFK